MKYSWLTKLQNFSINMLTWNLEHLLNSQLSQNFYGVKLPQSKLRLYNYVSKSVLFCVEEIWEMYVEDNNKMKFIRPTIIIRLVDSLYVVQ